MNGKIYTIRFNCIIVTELNDRDYTDRLHKESMDINKSQIPRITDVKGMNFQYYNHNYKGYNPEINQTLKYKITP